MIDVLQTGLAAMTKAVACLQFAPDTYIAATRLDGIVHAKAIINDAADQKRSSMGRQSRSS